MTDTYCGKSCADCQEKELLGCPGCKAGPGRPFVGDCDLAKCCTSKGQSSCANCAFSESCTTLWAKDQFQKRRLNSQETERKQKALLAQRAPVLHKWLNVMFWLLIPGIVLSFLSANVIAENAPGLYAAGEALSSLCTVAYCLVLFRLAREEDQYRPAGICMLLGMAVSAVSNWIFAGRESLGLALIIMIATTILTLMAAYHELSAHNTVMKGVDYGLAGKWETLWKWYLGSYAAFAGGTLLLVVMPGLGALILIAGSIGQIVVGVLKMVYLKQSAKRFWEYSVQGV